MPYKNYDQKNWSPCESCCYKHENKDYGYSKMPEYKCKRPTRKNCCEKHDDYKQCFICYPIDPCYCDSYKDPYEQYNQYNEYEIYDPYNQYDSYEQY